MHLNPIEQDVVTALLAQSEEDPMIAGMRAMSLYKGAADEPSNFSLLSSVTNDRWRHPVPGATISIEYEALRRQVSGRLAYLTRYGLDGGVDGSSSNDEQGDSMEEESEEVD